MTTKNEGSLGSVLSNTIDLSFEDSRSYDNYVLSNHETLTQPGSGRLNPIRRCCQRIVGAVTFRKAVIISILACSVLMGIETFDFIKKDPELEKLFESLDSAFLILFTLELVLQFGCHGLNLFRDSWLTFDFVIILLSWTLMQYPIQILRAFRIIRTFRLITRIKALRDLVQALINVVPRLVAIFLLLLLVFYVFAVLFTDLFGELYEEGYTNADYFSRLDTTAFTLFRIMLLDQWAQITIQCMDKYPWAWIPLFVFVMFTSFIVINLIIAVICDAVAQVQTDKIENTVDNLKREDIRKQQTDMAELKEKVDELSIIIKSLASKLLEDEDLSTKPLPSGSRKGYL